MKHSKILRILSLTLVILVSGCATFEDPYFQSGTVGGLAGAGAGAGAGALIGSAMTNGDVVQSALVGGAVGLPLGILAGVAYRSYIEQRDVDRNDDTIRANYDYITGRQRELERLREDYAEDSFAILPDKSQRTYMYDGPSIGVYNRP